MECGDCEDDIVDGQYGGVVTDILLSAILTLGVGAVGGALLVLRQARTRLGRRLHEIERRLDDLLASSSTADVLAELTQLQSALNDHGTDVKRLVRESTAPLRSGKQSVEQRTRRAVAHDVHALLALHSQLPLAAESVALSGYAASPDALLRLVTLVDELPEGALVVEVGSGLSTIWMAAAARRSNRNVRIVSIDHDERWGDETAAAVARLNLGAWCDVRIAPLTAASGESGDATPWYDLAGFHDLTEIALLVVDGPPGSTGPHARYPAVPQLRDRLVAGSIIVLDDTDRADEQEVLARWVADLETDFIVTVSSGLERTTIVRLSRRDN